MVLKSNFVSTTNLEKTETPVLPIIVLHLMIDYQYQILLFFFHVLFLDYGLE
jgi:hypothetical protein